MTRDQERARELVALIEGTNLECRMAGNDLILTSEMGQTYRIDPDAEAIWINGKKRTDLTGLEMLYDDPMFGAAHCDPGDMPDHRELRSEISPPVTDYHEDRWADLRAEAKRIEDDREFYRRQEAA